jgi:CheY-like chemotaxis protein
MAAMPSGEPCRGVIFVVDDDEGIRESLADVLQDEGYVVVTAIDGQDALDKLRAHQPMPCVILLDLMMPVMSGQQFYAEQQRDPALASIPVVILSADTNLKQKAASLGGEYLQKPVQLERILDAVDRLCA